MSSLKNVVEIPDSSDDEAVPAVTPKRYRGSGKADAPLEIESDSDGEPPAKRSLTAPAAPVPAQDPIKAARPRSLDTDAPAVDDLAEAEGGLWHVGMRQGGGADKTGARSLSEDDYKGILRRFGFEIAFDMRRGTLRSKCEKKKGGPCGANPEWTCNCPKDSRIQEIHVQVRDPGRPQKRQSRRERGIGVSRSRVAVPQELGRDPVGNARPP